ncbi:MAG: lipocalin family protein [Spirosomaceae bacterium]|nr:lipocalin family protein [Spirosomataceae bacterium]
MKAIFYVFLSALLLLEVVACKRNSSEPEPIPAGATKADLLAGTTTKSWTLVDTKIDGLDAWSQTRPCAKDDFLSFRKDKNYEWNDGTLRCSDKIPQVYEKGTWELATNDTEIILNKTERYKIVALSSSKLQLSSKNVFGETKALFFEVLTSN